MNMIVGVTGRNALSRVCLAGGGRVSLTVGVAERSTVEVGVAEGVKILSMVAEVTEGVTFSVFCACIGEGRRGGVGLCTFIVLI